MEATATLADALLDDLDDLSDVEEVEKGPEVSDETETNGLPPQQSYEHKAAPSRAHYLDSAVLQNHLKAIREYNSSNNNNNDQDDHPLIVQSNKLLAKLADELSLAHQELCQAYEPRFPELEELLPNPLHYQQAVLVIRNETDLTKVNDRLNEFLASSQILTISVAGSTTTGRALTEAELRNVDEAAQYLQAIVDAQREMTAFVTSRMQGLAPSVCALIGPAVAAQLIGLAGGLAELARIPACNLQVLGQTKANAASRAGLSSVSTRPHQGILMQCDLVQGCPNQALKKRALKTVAAKLALAARCDFVNVDTGRPRTAAMGHKFRREIEEKIHKWLEPDKAPTLKALPKPDLAIKKRRGGKRMRRIKERFEETAMMKQANTRAFSAQAGEYGDDAMGLTMGLLDTADVSAGGNLRKTTEKRKMRQANTKASRKKQAQMNAKQHTSGLETSVVFTPVQGMELVNPDANKERVRAANQKWFSDSAGFQSALPKKDK